MTRRQTSLRPVEGGKYASAVVPAGLTLNARGFWETPDGQEIREVNEGVRSEAVAGVLDTMAKAIEPRPPPPGVNGVPGYRMLPHQEALVRGDASAFTAGIETLKRSLDALALAHQTKALFDKVARDPSPGRPVDLAQAETLVEANVLKIGDRFRSQGKGRLAEIVWTVIEVDHAWRMIKGESEGQWCKVPAFTMVHRVESAPVVDEELERERARLVGKRVRYVASEGDAGVVVSVSRFRGHRMGVGAYEGIRADKVGIGWDWADRLEPIPEAPLMFAENGLRLCPGCRLMLHAHEYDDNVCAWCKEATATSERESADVPNSKEAKPHA